MPSMLLTSFCLTRCLHWHTFGGAALQVPQRMQVEHTAARAALVARQKALLPRMRMIPVVLGTGNLMLLGLTRADARMMKRSMTSTRCVPKRNSSLRATAPAAGRDELFACRRAAFAIHARRPSIIIHADSCSLTLTRALLPLTHCDSR